ncbi:unnamed protein product [Sphagnum balticum]
MAAPNYDQGSCCIYEGWRFGSVKRKIRRWRTEAGLMILDIRHKENPVSCRDRERGGVRDCTWQ